MNIPEATVWLISNLSRFAIPTLSNKVWAAWSLALTCGIGSSLSNISTSL